jgi:predicted alpha/beta-hydrolase family hydrolase
VPRVPTPPPGSPEKSRLGELDEVKVPTLVVQGESDPFGVPPAGLNRKLARVPGTHSLRSSATVAAAVSDWLVTLAPTLGEGSAKKAG